MYKLLYQRFRLGCAVRVERADKDVVIVEAYGRTKKAAFHNAIKQLRGCVASGEYAKSVLEWLEKEHRL